MSGTPLPVVETPAAPGVPNGSAEGAGCHGGRETLAAAAMRIEEGGVADTD